MNKDIILDLAIKEIHSISSIYTQKGKRIIRHDRPCWAIIMKYEGETVYYSSGKEITSNISNMVILPKGCDYEWVCTESGHFYTLEFDSDSSYNEILPFKIKNPEKFLNMFKEIEYKRTAKTTMYKTESFKIAYDMILHLAQSGDRTYMPSKKQKITEPAVEYILKNYDKKIKNDELASLCGISTVYFRKIFKEAFGMTPANYIHEIRMKKAKEMLKSDFGSIGEIAKSLGYLNIYDFSRDFKKHMGIPPSKY